MRSTLKAHVSLISTHRGAALMNSTEAFHLLRTWTKLLRAYKINMEAHMMRGFPAQTLGRFLADKELWVFHMGMCIDRSIQYIYEYIYACTHQQKICIQCIETEHPKNLGHVSTYRMSNS